MKALNFSFASSRFFLLLFLCSSTAALGCNGGSSGVSTDSGSTGSIGGGVGIGGGGAGTGGGGTGGGGTGGTGGGGTGGGGSGGGGSTPTGGTPPGDGIGQETFTGVAGGDGFSDLVLNIQGSSSFQVVIAAPGISLRTNALISPSAQIVVSQDDNPITTLAVEPYSEINALTYPTKGDDDPVAAGLYTQRLQFSQAAAAFQGTLLTKNDSNPLIGTLLVNVYLVGSANGSRADVSTAIETWRAVFGQIGVTLDVVLREISGESLENADILPDPSSGSAFYLETTAAQGERSIALHVFVAEDIAIGDDPSRPDTSVLGVAGGIPGAGVPTSKSAVAISLVAHQGIDGVLSAEERRILGETLAHEAGHFLGLFHPVEPGDGDNFVGEDPLQDTPECRTIETCVATGAAANNMFPTAQPGISQQTLTQEQSQVINLQVIVR